MNKQIAFYGAAAVGIYTAIDYNGPKWFLATPAYIQAYAPNEWTNGQREAAPTDWHRGVRADGQVFYTTPFGLILEVAEMPPLSDELSQGLPVSMPDVDWLYASLERGDYSKRDMTVLLSRLKRVTTEYIENARKVQREGLEKMWATLTEYGTPINDTTMSLLSRLNTFNYTYEQCDTSRYTSLREAHRQLDRDLADYEGLKKLFSQKFKDAYAYANSVSQ